MAERFSAYGFRLDIPDDWRIEFNAKNTRQRGDVAFHSPSNNVFYLSWGKLEEAKKRFKSLEEHRNETVKRIGKNPNMQKVDIVTSSRQAMSTHEGLLSNVVAQGRRGLLGRVEPSHEIWSVHFYCPETGRYYVAYWHIKAKNEFPEVERMFKTIIQSVGCHP